MSHSSYKDGLIIRGRRRSWRWITEHMLCRKCRQPVGKPYTDHITGEIDFERVTCHGDERHEIVDEGGLIPMAQHDWEMDQAAWRSLQVQIAYELTKPLPNGGVSLYGDDAFEGFG